MGRWCGRGCRTARSRAQRALPQDFLALFEELREEIVNDPLLKGQPEFSKDWVCKVCGWREEAMQRIGRLCDAKYCKCLRVAYS